MVAGKFRPSWRQAFCLGALLAFAAAGTNVVVADDDIRDCAKIEDDTQRLACYDREADDRQQSSEHFGMPRPPDEEAEMQAQVTRCEQSANERYYFFLDNKQVWKQTRSDRRRFKDCNFAVTITKDFFGYKMQMDDDERAIRIKRVR